MSLNNCLHALPRHESYSRRPDPRRDSDTIHKYSNNSLLGVISPGYFFWALSANIVIV